MSRRDNKTVAAEFRELVGMDFDEITCQAPVKLLLALAKFADPINLSVLQFASEPHALFEQQRGKLREHYAPRGSARMWTRPPDAAR